jgi:hypothetical protein
MSKETNGKSITTEDMRSFDRIAFNSVMEAYENIESSIGYPGAVDYSKITGGSGAQFSDKGAGQKLIEFAIDVENVISKSVTPFELRNWGADVFNLEQTTLTEVVLAIRERLGRRFIGRGLSPVNKYFKREVNSR